MSSGFEDAVGAPGRLSTLLSLLAALALILGAVGVYGMISHFVTRRMREYGIRLALGLSPERVVSQVLGQGLIAYAFAHLPASLSSVSLLVQPVMAALFAWALFGEAIGIVQLAGGAIVLTGIWIARKGS